MAVNRDQVIQGAERHVARGRLELAIHEYDRVLTDAPRDANTLNRVGDLWLRLGKVDEAKKVFVRTANIYVEDGFLVKAIAMYKKIIKCDPSGIDAYERLASLYHRQGLLNEARTQYQVLADYHLKHQNPTAAAAMLERTVELEPDNPAPRARLAELYQQLGAVERSSSERRTIAELLLNDGHEEEALKVLQGAVALRPEDDDFAVDCVRWLRGAGRKGAAVRLLAWAAEKRPSLRQRTDFEPVPSAAASTGEPAPALASAAPLAPLAPAAPLAQVAPLAPPAPVAEPVAPVSGAEWTLPDLEHPSVPSPAHPPPDVTFSFEPFSADQLREAQVGKETPRLEPQTKFDSLELELEDLQGLPSSEFRVVEPVAPISSTDWPRPAGATTAPQPDLAPPEMAAPAQSPLDAGEVRLGTAGSARPHLDLSELGQAADEIARRQAPRPQRVDEAVAEAEVLARYGLITKAIERLRAILRTDPVQHEAHRALVTIYLDHSRLDRAADAATQMATSSPGATGSSAWLAIRAQLLALGFQIDGRTVLPPVDFMPRTAEGRGAMGVDALLRGLVQDKTRQRPGRKAAPATPATPERPAPKKPIAAAPPETVQLPPLLPNIDTVTAAPISSDGDVLRVEPLEPQSPGAQTGEVRAASDWLDLGDLSAPWTELPVVRSSLPRRAKPAPAAPAAPEDPAAAPPPVLLSAAENLFEDTAVSWLKESLPAEVKPKDEIFSGESEFFDLAAELEKELSEERSRLPVVPEVAEQSLEDIVATFKKGVAEVLSAEDYDTHFNLGIAYREMGLTDEAIGEFQLAARAPQHLLDCCSLLGLCFLEKGIPELAVKWYRRGLDTLGLSEEQGLALRYDLGHALATVGERAEAYKVFVEIYGSNSNYRDVVARVAELRPR